MNRARQLYKIALRAVLGHNYPMLDVLRDIVLALLQAVVFIGGILGTIAIVGGMLIAIVAAIQFGVVALWEAVKGSSSP